MPHAGTENAQHHALRNSTQKKTHRADSLQSFVELESENLLEVRVEEAVDDEVRGGVEYQKEMVEPGQQETEVVFTQILETLIQTFVISSLDL